MMDPSVPAASAPSLMADDGLEDSLALA